MRAFSTLTFSLLAAFVAAQTSSAPASSPSGTSSTGPNAFSIPAGQSSYNVAAGGTVDLAWTNQQGSTVTIKLQQSGSITPDSGLTLAQSIPNTGSTTVTIPGSSDIPPGTYTFEIIDDSNASTYNFSPNFSMASASGTGSFGASATGSASASASGSASASATTTGSSASASNTSSGSAAASTTKSSAATSSTASSSQTTSAPNSNAGAKVQAPLAAAVMLGAAAFL